jgi:RND family efflux transporter MFP subunit
MKPVAPPIFLMLLLLAAPASAQSAADLATRIIEPRGVALAMPVDGMVEARHQATVAAQVSGRLLEVRVDAGQRVGQGQLLARIDARESAEAVAAARANTAAAKAALERTRKLVAQKYMSPAVLDQAQATYDAAAAQVQASEVNNGHARIVSPISGLVAMRYVEPGEMAAPGRTLFTIYQPRDLRMVVHVPQSRLAEVRASKNALLEFADAGQRLESSAIQILPTIDGETHTAIVRIDLPAGASFAVPGMAGRVRFLSGESIRMTVPKSAVVHRGEVAGVYVRDASGRFRLRQLRLGEVLADGEVEVLAGLLSGEAVALDPIKAALSARR